VPGRYTDVAAVVTAAETSYQFSAKVVARGEADTLSKLIKPQVKRCFVRLVTPDK
jgi:hypothetical protein